MEREREIILSINIQPSFEEFLKMLSISSTKTLAAKLLEPVYQQIFVYSKNLRDEYVRYYSVEYLTIGEYLEICHNVTLSDDELGKQYIFKFKNNCQLTDTAYDRENEQYLERIITQLKKMEQEHEN